jgi:hypothetical protein
MILFIKKASLYALIMLVFILVFEGFLRHIPNDYTYKKIFLDQHSNTIETLFLGNSHAYFDLNPAYFSDNCFNAAYVSQSLNYDVEILEKYDGKWNKLQSIVIPISYFTLFSTLETSIESWRVKNYMIYYGFNSSYKIKNYSEFLSNDNQINLLKLYAYYWSKQNTISCSKLGFGLDYNSKSQINLEESGLEASKRHTIAHFNDFEENKNYLLRLIQFTKTRHIKVYLFTPPAYFTYRNSLNKTQLNKTVETVESIQKENNHVVYVNYLTDSTFVKTDFYDADHLNEIGAKKMTLMIRDLVAPPQ